MQNFTTKQFLFSVFYTACFSTRFNTTVCIALKLYLSFSRALSNMATNKSVVCENHRLNFELSISPLVFNSHSTTI
jgi:hypothetical protein